MNYATCSKDACKGKSMSLGLCQKHYSITLARPWTFSCNYCGAETTRNARVCPRSCSKACQTNAGLDRRAKTELTVAYLAKDAKGVIRALRNRSVLDPSGCWSFISKSDAKGYKRVTVAGVSLRPHRLAAQFAVAGFSDSLPVHHICANASCCNPEHLRVVTSQENTAEMWERRSFEKRILALESALRRVDPTNPMLA